MRGDEFISLKTQKQRARGRAKDNDEHPNNRYIIHMLVYVELY
jgi:hypothetical protein